MFPLGLIWKFICDNPCRYGKGYVLCNYVTVTIQRNTHNKLYGSVHLVLHTYTHVYLSYSGHLAWTNLHNNTMLSELRKLISNQKIIIWIFTIKCNQMTLLSCVWWHYCPVFDDITVLCVMTLLSCVWWHYCPVFNDIVLCVMALLSCVWWHYCPVFYDITVLCFMTLLSCVWWHYCPVFDDITVLC